MIPSINIKQLITALIRHSKGNELSEVLINSLKDQGITASEEGVLEVAETEEDRLMSRREAAEYIGVSYMTLSMEKYRQLIPHIKVGKSTLYKKSDLDTFISSRGKKGHYRLLLTNEEVGILKGLCQQYPTLMEKLENLKAAKLRNL